MNELLAVLRAIPRPARWLTTVFLFSGLAYAVARLLRLGNKSWIPVVAVVVICGAFYLFETLRGRSEKKRSREFEGSLGLHSRKSEVGKEEIREALAELSEKWQTSVAQLREAGMSIYSLPWYLLIGEPQSGKSTTLKNSGLEFPVGADALSGSGGTRNCDWWFSNEAVILDTAGRFTFQEESAPDQHEWTTFLKLLRKHRKYCPVNGVIVVIPATSLVEDPADEQERKAKNIRQKLLHLQKLLEIRFPIFILVTKADRILGFTEFFSKLDPVDQRQLFGWSNPGPPEEGWDLKSFSGTFDEIVDRVHKQRVRFLKDEENIPLVDKLFVFPEELEALKEPLANYFQTIFATSRYEEPFLFRGFYLTSGVQQGRPIARACRDLLRVQVGDPQGVLDDLEQVFHKSRAFFIRDFYEKKLFPEQGLIARTRAALKKDQKYRWVMYGLSGGIITLTVLLLLFGSINLFRVIKPINDTVQGARSCLDPQAAMPCEVQDAYRLIVDFEKHKQRVRESKWTLRSFLRSSERNEITTELVPAIQAQLFQRNVLAPVLASFEARSRAAGLWDQHAKSYPEFYEGFRQLLRFKRLQGGLGQDLASLRADVRIAPVLAFLKATPGLDPQGKGIDAWLKGGVDLAQTDKIFSEAMATSPDLTRLAVPEPAGPHQAFRDYWTIRNVARWDALTDEYLRTYKTLYEEMLGLAPTAAAPFAPALVAPAAVPGTAPAPALPTAPVPADPAATAAGTAAAPTTAQPVIPGGGMAVLTRFAELSQRFADNYAKGEAHMKTERQPPGATRPGQNVQEWEGNCVADYNALLQISPLISGPDAAAHCRQIPGQWMTLSESRGQYQYLFTPKTQQAPMTWSADAARVKGPLVDLGTLASPQQIATDRQALQTAIHQQTSSQARLSVVNERYKAEEQRIFAPAGALTAFTGKPVEAVAPPATDPAAAATAAPPPPAPPVSPFFRLDQGLPRAHEVAALAFGLRILPPAAEFFASDLGLGLGCNCFNSTHAREHIPLASSIVNRVRKNLQPEVLAQQDVDAPIQKINQAEYSYLEEFIGRQKWGIAGGGGGGGGAGGESFIVPARARQAGAWKDFVRAIRGWQPVIEKPGGGGGAPAPVATVASAEGLTRELMESFANDNDHLRPLLAIFEERGRTAAARAAAAASRPPARVSQDLAAAAETFKHCISGLDDDPVKAWRQLVLAEDGASLKDFHAFSANRRLQGNRTAESMVAVETQGAKLLSQAIRPVFTDRLRNLWSIAGSCCGDRFPFLSRARLQAQQESYQNGPSGDGLWAPPGRDTAQRSLSDALQLETVSLDALDRLFFAGGSLDSLFTEFAVEPIIEGREKMIDFVGTSKERLRVLRQWQHFVYGDGQTSASQQVKVKLLATASTAPRTFMGERMGQVNLFGPYAVRPSTDAARVRILTMPLLMEDRPTSITGRNEDKSGGWSGNLNLRGGPLKIPYLLHLASSGRPREGGRIWTVRLQLPDYQQPQQRLEGVFEFTFERPLPEIVPGANIDGL
jgi:hypothetical protein